MELDDQIVNRTIAEFMGGFLDKHDEDYVLTVMPYTESLDALVPVWEKAKISEITIFHDCIIHRNTLYKRDTIQQAAAYATYKAIKELRDE
jgi:hypothetical protein